MNFVLPHFLKLAFLTIVTSIFIFLAQDKVAFRDFFVETLPTKNSSVPLNTSTLAEALKSFYTPKSLFLDVREKQFYDYGHIENALNIPLEEIKSIPDPLLRLLRNAPTVVVYCNGVACGKAYLAARLLSNKGLTNVSVYAEGWPEWRECHLPITMSEAMKQDIAREGQNP